MIHPPRLLTPVVALALAAGCARSQGAGAQRPAAAALAVRVAPVTPRDVVYRIQALGSLEAQELVQVTAEVEGAVSQVLFHEGDHVTPSSVLLRIDPERYRLEAAGAEASYRKAVAEAERARGELARRDELAAERLVSAEDLTRAKQDAERLAADAAAARAAWDLALQNQKRSEVRPPAAGVINTRSVDTGQFVKNGNVLATLVDTSRLRLRFKIAGVDSLRVRRDDLVGFRVQALGEREFQARIYHVGEVADTTTRQVEVLGWVKNPGELKPGFFAEVNVATEQRQGALVVPEGAVQASERGFVAYVVEGDTARLRQIEIGLRTGDGVVEVRSGLNAGDTVVIEGSDRLADGVAVKAVAAAAASGRGGGGASPTAAAGPPAGR